MANTKGGEIIVKSEYGSWLVWGAKHGRPEEFRYELVSVVFNCRPSAKANIKPPHWQRAITLTELMLAVAIIGILAAVAIPAYERYVERAKVANAIIDISSMSATITFYINDNRAPPVSLADVSLAGKLDPWKRPYIYTNLDADKGKGSARKDKKLNPLNSDFDLYSVGKDGESKLPLSPKVSEDDVIRARDGRFVGLARDFDP
jgi:general secretion pathway protein G